MMNLKQSGESNWPRIAAYCLFALGLWVSMVVSANTQAARPTWNSRGTLNRLSENDLVSDPTGHNPDRGGFLVGGNAGLLLLRHSDIDLDVRLRVVGLGGSTS